MEKVWKVKDKKGNFNPPILEKYHPVILKLLVNREIEKESEIEKYFNFDYEKDLSDAFSVLGIRKAVERIIQAGKNKEKIAIFADYDADGVSAAAVLYESLVNLGFKDVICYIPDRQSEGYGMNLSAINYLADKKVKLIITVDCGITNIKEVEKAKNLGIEVIITDHHHALPKIPEALATIDPSMPCSGFVFKNLAGVGVAFKLAQALYQKMAPAKIEQLKWSLDLAAIGTIADCVTLLGENRILVKYGLIVISKTKRVGLQELFKVGRIKISEDNPADARKIAFQISPRINAAGRMDHANASFKLLIENDPVLARDLALEIENKNQLRQKVTAEIFREVEVLARNSFKNKKFIFAENSNWPVGILGLVAGKITEEFGKPTAVFQRQKKEFVGSFRSLPEINIIKIIEKCSELLIKFGGHSQAAGVSVKPENIEKFYDKISQLIEKELEGKETTPILNIDCEIGAGDISWELAYEIKKMEPFGTGNIEPVFLARNMLVSDSKIVGNGSKHLKLSIRSEDGSPKIFDAIGFSLAERFSQIKKDDRIDIVFNIRQDEWNGSQKIQLRLIDLKLK